MATCSSEPGPPVCSDSGGGSHTFHQYPAINSHNSAFSLFFDHRHRLWVGSWGYGVACIDNPSDIRNPNIHQYPYKNRYFDTFYQIVEDPATHTLWAGTREGICILDETKPEAGWQKYEGIDDCKLSFCRSISTDQHGNIWLGTLNNGIIQIDTNTSPFRLWQLSLNPGLNLCYINSILTNDGCHFWLGLSPYGIALYNRETHSTLYNKEIPGFEDIKDWMLSTSITHIIQRHNGEIWFANNSFGIIIKKKDAKAMVINTGNVSYLKDSYVNTL